MTAEELDKYVKELATNPNLSGWEKIKRWRSASPPLTPEESQALEEKMAFVTFERERELAFDLPPRH